MCSKPERENKCCQSLVDNLIQLGRVSPKDGDVLYTEFSGMLKSYP